MTPGNRNNAAVLIPILLGGVFIVVGGLLISTLTPSLFPDQASQEARQIDGLFRVLLGIGGAIFLLVEGLLLYSVIRFRTPVASTEDGPTIHGNVLLEVIWTAIPAVIVLFLVVYSYQVWRDLRRPKDNEYVINAVGQRFAWTFEYTDPRVEDTMPARDLHTYVGQNVRMHMVTSDVIHSFWVPAMRVKQDLLPGRETEVRFTPAAIEGATYPLVYRVVCAELCGSGHGAMFTLVYIYENEAQYMEMFLDPMVERVLNPPADPVLRGANILASGAYPCAGCHVLQAQAEDGSWSIDWAGITGPTLTGVGNRAGQRVAGSPAEEYLYRSIFHPAEYLVPGFGALMPRFQPQDPAAPNYMPPTDVYAIVAYLCSVNDAGDATAACDLENLLSVVNQDNPDNPVILEAGGAEATPEAESTPAAESAAEGTPEAEATAESTVTP